MTRLIAIAVLIVCSVLLIRYRASAKLQYGVIIAFALGFVSYVAYLMMSELFR